MSLRHRTLLGIGLATLAVLFLALLPSWLPGNTTTTTTAVEGPPLQVRRACDLGNRLLQGNVYDQARTAYIRALEVEFPRTTTTVATQQATSTMESPYECAYAGLRRIPPAAPAVAGAPAPATPLAAAPAAPSTTSPPEVGPAAAETVEGLFGTLTGRLGRRLALGTAGWFLLLGAVAYVLRRGVVAYWRRIPGPVEVAQFEGPSEAAAPKAPELAALMRQHLADAQLQPPSSLPGSSFEEQLTTAIEAAPLADKSGLGKLAGFLVKIIYPRTTYKVTGTYRTDDSRPQPYGLTYQLLGQPPAVKGDISLVGTVWAASYSQAAAKASYAIAAKLLGQEGVRKHAPPHVQWASKDGEPLRKFEQAKALHQQRRLDEAIVAYREVVRVEPRNALVRLGLGTALEERQLFLEAIQVYLTTVALWPRLFEARYRLAGALSFVDVWADSWVDADQAGCREAIHRLLAEIGESAPPNHQQDCAVQVREAALGEVKRCFLTTAVRQYNQLLMKADSKRERAGAKTARICTRLQLRAVSEDVRTAPSINGLRADLDDLLTPSVHWIARYNAACFYSHLLRVRPSGHDDDKWEATRDGYAKVALRHLDLALADPDTEFEENLDWVLTGDPDLKALRSHPRFADWVEQTFHVPRSSPDTWPSEKARQDLAIVRGTWDGTARAARMLADHWWKRGKALRLLSPPARSERNACYDQETQLWKTLARWTSDPFDPAGRTSFVDRLQTVVATVPDTLGVGKLGPTVPPDPASDTELECLRARLLSLGECADRQARYWADVRDQELSRPEPPPPIVYRLRRQADEAGRVWKLLANWAHTPHEAALERAFTEVLDCVDHAPRGTEAAT
jgi:tetratricopeptide (TPR) repeat protein